MGNSWETVFHLSSFMKYLLAEVLPLESSLCPQNAIECLFELLSVTQDCLKLATNSKKHKSSVEKHNLKSEPSIHKHNESIEGNGKTEPTLPIKGFQEVNSRSSSRISLNKSSAGHSRLPEINQLDKNLYRSEESLSQYSRSSSRSGFVKEESSTTNWADESEEIHENRKSSRSDYIFTEKFLYINDSLNPESQNMFYCRPCDVFGDCAEDMENHLSERKHIDFMGSRIYKNFKGVCSYCKMTILGTDRTVNEYMKYHGARHSQVSYDLIEVEFPSEINSRNTHRYNRESHDSIPENSYTEVDSRNRSRYNRQLRDSIPPKNSPAEGDSRNWSRRSCDSHSNDRLPGVKSRNRRRYAKQSHDSTEVQSRNRPRYNRQSHPEDQSTNVHHNNMHMQNTFSHSVKYTKEGEAEEESHEIKYHNNESNSNNNIEADEQASTTSSNSVSSQINSEIQRNNVHLFDEFYHAYKFRCNMKPYDNESTFLGFCLRCEESINDWFQWMDHLSSPNHLSKKSQQIEEATDFSSMNLSVFGSKCLLEKLKD